MGKEIHRQTHAGEKMSSSPECKICGDYIHHGDVVCSRCLPKILQSERERVLDELMELIRVDLKADFDEELYITHQDLLWCVSELRQKAGEQE